MVAFVILHYLSINDTIRCIESIQNLKHKQFKIIVVDNNSPNESGRELIKKYRDNEAIKIILNDKNYGFSGGNNIGCRYAINNVKPDFICVINNDTYIKDPYFIEKIYESYNKYSFDVMGPKILVPPKMINQNPFGVPSCIEEIERDIQYLLFSQKLLYSKMPILYYFYNRFVNKFRKNYKALGLHGAALIFSSKYYTKFNTIFPEVTFMYGEESLLYYRKIKSNLIYIYDENLEIIHCHSSSTRMAFKDKDIIEKWKFQHKYMLEARYKLKEIYEKNVDI